jgi:hypothetical protein
VFAGAVWDSFFDPAVRKTLPFHMVQAATLLMVASAILALWGLWVDKWKTTAIVVLLAVLPLYVVLVRRTGW